MELDIRTLCLVNALIALIISLVMFVIWRTQKYSSSLGWITLGFVCLMIGALLSAFPTVQAHFVSIIAANLVYLLWVVFVWKGVRDFQGLSFPRQEVLLSLLLFVCIYICYTYIYFDGAMRVIVLSTFVIIYSIFTVLDLLKPIHQSAPSIENRYIVVIVLCFSFLLFTHTVVALLEKINFHFVSVEWFQQISVLIFILYSVAFALGFLWVIQTHLEHQVYQRAEELDKANALAKQLYKQAEKAAFHDSLTQAGNRRKFSANIILERERHLRHQHPLCLAFVDIDHFKQVNDKYGHAKGDQVLKSLVSYFMDIIRNIDMVYRWGGEEFIILLPETKLAEALPVCERLRLHIESNLKIEKQPVTVSIGVTQLRDSENIDTFIQRADQRLYLAKQNGRNCVIGS